MKRAYVDGSNGQVHLQRWGDAGAPPLICLPPSPFSGVAFATLAPLLAPHRPVVALDYPGYGNSDPTPGDPSIADYSTAVADVANAISPQAPVDLIGFHTGCLVAVESALRFPDRVNRIVLVDVPYFDPDKRAELLTKMGAVKPLQPDLAMLSDAWEFCVTKRLEHIPLPRAYEMFVDHILVGERSNAAFRAAFSYPCEQRFPMVATTTQVIATKAGLYEPSLEAAKVIPGASLLELPEISVAVLEAGANAIAEAVTAALA